MSLAFGRSLIYIMESKVHVPSMDLGRSPPMDPKSDNELQMSLFHGMFPGEGGRERGREVEGGRSREGGR